MLNSLRDLVKFGTSYNSDHKNNKMWSQVIRLAKGLSQIWDKYYNSDPNNLAPLLTIFKLAVFYSLDQRYNSALRIRKCGP